MKPKLADLDPAWGRGDSEKREPLDRATRYLRRAYNKDGPEVFMTALIDILKEANYLGDEEPTVWHTEQPPNAEIFIAIRLLQDMELKDRGIAKAGECVIVYQPWARGRIGTVFKEWTELPKHLHSIPRTDYPE